MSNEKRKVSLGDDALPPPGDARREELKRREDTLQEAAERLSDEQELDTIDPSKLEVDREFAQHWDPATASILTVSNPQPGWEYTWQNAVNQSGLQVMMKKTDGWQVVSGSDPESREHKHADGTRRIGDVLLMKIRKERKDQLDRRDEIRRERVQRGVTKELEDMGERMRGKGVRVHTPYTESSRHGFSHEEQTYDPRRRFTRDTAQKEAAKMLGEKLREEVPGVPLPGKGG